MKLADLLNPQLIVAELSATTKAGVLQELSELLSSHAAVIGNGRLGKTEILQVLLERERLGSTGIGEGIALPHGRLASLDRLMLGLGRSRVGVDFEAVDGEPAHLFFLLLSPEGSARHLQVLATLARLLRDGAVRQRLLAADSAQAMYEELLGALAET